ncbi:Apolipophorin [Amphibalanus amphitrite]|uniref:Apolipophorin n=1 Tax=Amphibalanus amphitrite TaxID=1232801 RepID=A0A6A4WIE0_AMPAM|nr:Apolipophorin [Amphibalanus amphitrite]
MGPPGVLGVLALLLVLQLAACQKPTKFKYTVGESYRYKYSASTASTVLGVTRKSTNLTLECDVIVHVITPCEHAITIENVQLNTVAEDQGSTVDRNIESDSFSSPLESYHLRGIVSTLQNSMDRIDLDYSDVERDVTGDCPVSYAVEGTDGAALVISKKRDLNACVGRFAHTSHIQGVGYSIKSPVQNIPVVASTSTCRQKVLTNRLTSVICEERHLLKPFSNDESGAVTITSQNLTLVPEDTANAGVSESKSASHTREKSLADAKALVEELCENDSEVRVESTTKFSQLIDDLRGMTHAEIRALHQHSPSICRHGQQLIEDALPVVSTAGSLNLMTDLIVDGKVTDRVANTWLLALNFIPSVDQEMLRIASGLLEVRNPAVATRARLAAGAVLYQYCRQHEKCDRDSVALETMEQLVRPLGADCRANSEEEERKVLLTLRAAGNAGLSPPSVVDTLNECFMSRDNPARIKVAAIEAFRRFSCTVRRDFMRAVFRDMAEDSEVRIAAYLGLMRCPSHQEVGLVRAALEREQVNQVGSFVWTHLMNLQETASPYQLEVQGLLADLHLQNKFSIDTRKYSRNFEISGFNSEYHVGASLDSNLVYSSKSYIPRSLNSNLTLQMFGESVNLLEVGARVEGMERLVESVFAPGGGLHNAAPEPLFRSRRDATQREKLEKIKADFDAAGRMGDPQAFFHMKVKQRNMVKQSREINPCLLLSGSCAFSSRNLFRLI